MKKRILSLLLAMSMILLLAGCGGEQTIAVETTAATTSAIAETTKEDVTEEIFETETDAQQEDETDADDDIDTETEAETDAIAETTTVEETTEAGLTVAEDGEYNSKDEVALYIHLYGKLPSNYITKYDAEDLGWDSSAGNLWDVAPGKSIGGSKFGNYEGLLPDASGRKYYECDIDYEGGYRNAKRIIYSNDGLVYYTEDHYKTFELLYGEE